MKHRALTITAGAVVATAAVGGAAWAQGGSASPGTAAASAATATTTAATHPAGAKHRRGGFAGRALHGQFTVERKGTPTVVDVQRGAVTAASPTSLTVKSKDGYVATYTVTPTTKVRSKGAAASASAITPGDRVGVLADDDAGHPQARAVRILPTKAG